MCYLVYVIVALTILLVISVNGDACNKAFVPMGIRRDTTLTPVTTTVAAAGDHKIEIFGYVDYIDGCSLVLKEFKYYPPLIASKLYGAMSLSNATGRQPVSESFPISSKAVLSADGSLSQEFKLDQGKSLDDFNVVQIFSEYYKVVIAEAKMYDVVIPSKGEGSLRVSASAVVGCASLFITVMASILL